MLQKTESGFLGEMADGSAKAGKIQDEAGAPCSDTKWGSTQINNKILKNQ